MFMQAPTLNAHIHQSEVSKAETQLRERSPSTHGEFNSSAQIMLDTLLGGVLILTEQRELIFANESARRILRLLNLGKPQLNLVPNEIWHLCQSLIQSRSLFPNQYWQIESKIFIASSISFQVRVGWHRQEMSDRPYLLLVIQDQYQSIKTVALEEACKYGLTSREQEIWLLQRAGYTYKQISAELQITPNTVKKHMKSIHVKQKTVLEWAD